jgi:hypothetical protein
LVSSSFPNEILYTLIISPSQMVSLEFFIDIILLIALWPWGWLSL